MDLTIYNFSFVDEKLRLTSVPESVPSKPTMVLGKVCLLDDTNLIDFSDYTTIFKTSIIKEFDKNTLIVKTVGGSNHTLFKMSEDYMQYLQALRYNIPVLTEWFLLKLGKGYFIFALENERKFFGLISYQNSSGNFIKVGNKFYFVDWKSMSKQQLKILLKYDRLMSDCPKKLLREFAGITCKPTLHLY